MGIHRTVVSPNNSYKMKLVLLLVSACVVYAMAAPQKRLIIDDLANEASKILMCEGKLTEEACKKCCDEQTWYVSAEASACKAACNILPDAADYITTTLIPGGPF